MIDTPKYLIYLVFTNSTKDVLSMYSHVPQPGWIQGRFLQRFHSTSRSWILFWKDLSLVILFWDHLVDDVDIMFFGFRSLQHTLNQLTYTFYETGIVKIFKTHSLSMVKSAFAIELTCIYVNKTR